MRARAAARAAARPTAAAVTVLVLLGPIGAIPAAAAAGVVALWRWGR